MARVILRSSGVLLRVTQSLIFSLPTTPLTYFFILSLSSMVFWVLRLMAMEEE